MVIWLFEYDFLIWLLNIFPKLVFCSPKYFVLPKFLKNFLPNSKLGTNVVTKKYDVYVYDVYVYDVYVYDVYVYDVYVYDVYVYDVYVYDVYVYDVYVYDVYVYDVYVYDVYVYVYCVRSVCVWVRVCVCVCVCRGLLEGSLSLLKHEVIKTMGVTRVGVY